MKKLLMGFAACALILTSCNNNEVIENLDNSSGQLTFSPAIGKQTKAAEIMNTTLEGKAKSATDGIALYAYQKSGSNFGLWYADNLWYESGKWGIHSVRFRNTNETKYITYWPKDNVTPNPTSFTNATFTGTSFPTFTYTILTPDKQEDLIAGVTEVAANQTNITFGLRHILSQINFGVKGYKGAQITISEISVEDVSNEGTYTFGGQNQYPMGEWAQKDLQVETYSYNGGKSISVPEAQADVDKVETGDKYIFGDGGNWGAKINDNTWYYTSHGWRNQVADLNGRNLSNSLMLLPQDFHNRASKVTFKYTIKDAGKGVVVNNATGEFKLDFSATDNLYASEWKQNYRYIYIIDFTKFLEDNTLAFDVDLELYPWENYNHSGNNDGIVGVPALGETTNEAFNTPYTGVESGINWYAATRSRTAPNTDVQILNNETWNWEPYTFVGLAAGQSFNLKFDRVIFNGKTITLNLPVGFTATYNGTALANNAITDNTHPVVITNKYSYKDAAPLQVAVQAAATATAFRFTGDARTLDVTTWNTQLARTGEVTIYFAYNVPLVAPKTPWNWNASTQTATYKALIVGELRSELEAQTKSYNYVCVSGGAGVNLSSFNMSNAVSGTVITVQFKAESPTNSPNSKGWSWNATTNTATFTKP